MRPDCCLRGPTANTISLPALHLLSIQRLAFCPTVWLLEHLPPKAPSLIFSGAQRLPSGSRFAPSFVARQDLRIRASWEGRSVCQAICGYKLFQMIPVRPFD